MTLLFVLSNPQSKPALKGLIGACDRAQVGFMCFFTGAGVAMLMIPNPGMAPLRPD